MGIRINRYVVVELKAVPFEPAFVEPAFVGQLNMYLSAVESRRSWGRSG